MSAPTLTLNVALLEVVKARAHKYIRRYRAKDGKYRYVYPKKAGEGKAASRHEGGSTDHKSYLGDKKIYQPGTSFAAGAGKGHYVIESRKGNNVTFYLDEDEKGDRGESRTMTFGQFRNMLRNEHRDNFKRAAREGLQRRKDVLARTQPGTPARVRAENEVRRWESLNSDYLPRGSARKRAFGALGKFVKDGNERAEVMRQLLGVDSFSQANTDDINALAGKLESSTQEDFQRMLHGGEKASKDNEADGISEVNSGANFLSDMVASVPKSAAWEEAEQKVFSSGLDFDELVRKVEPLQKKVLDGEDISQEEEALLHSVYVKKIDGFPTGKLLTQIPKNTARFNQNGTLGDKILLRATLASLAKRFEFKDYGRGGGRGYVEKETRRFWPMQSDGKDLHERVAPAMDALGGGKLSSLERAAMTKRLDRYKSSLAEVEEQLATAQRTGHKPSIDSLTEERDEVKERIQFFEGKLEVKKALFSRIKSALTGKKSDSAASSKAKAAPKKGDGRWVTTKKEPRRKLYINGDGVPTKGNPHLLAAIKGENPRKVAEKLKGKSSGKGKPSGKGQSPSKVPARENIEARPPGWAEGNGKARPSGKGQPSSASGERKSKGQSPSKDQPGVPKTVPTELQFVEAGAKKIGKGGFGVVYADDGPPPHCVKYGRVSEKEKDIQGKAGELGVAPKVYGSTKDSIMMEYCNNHKSLARHKKTPTVLRNSVEAIRALHEAGIAHNDAHSGNILLDPTKKATVIDYGASTESPKEAVIEAAFREQMLSDRRIFSPNYHHTRMRRLANHAGKLEEFDRLARSIQDRMVDPGYHAKAERCRRLQNQIFADRKNKGIAIHAHPNIDEVNELQFELKGLQKWLPDKEMQSMVQEFYAGFDRIMEGVTGGQGKSDQAESAVAAGREGDGRKEGTGSSARGRGHSARGLRPNDSQRSAGSRPSSLGGEVKKALVNLILAQLEANA